MHLLSNDFLNLKYKHHVYKYDLDFMQMKKKSIFEFSKIMHFDS